MFALTSWIVMMVYKQKTSIRWSLGNISHWIVPCSSDLLLI
jgi:hypothetical protein